MTRIEELPLERASQLLANYLSEFSEHDQGDYRVYEAHGILQRTLLVNKPKKAHDEN